MMAGETAKAAVSADGWEGRLFLAKKFGKRCNKTAEVCITWMTGEKAYVNPIEIHGRI